MLIEFSRHARRRLRLYEIDESDVLEVIREALNRMPRIHGKIEVVEERFHTKYRYPLKVVFAVEGERTTVVTNYPLKGKSIK